MEQPIQPLNHLTKGRTSSFSNRRPSKEFLRHSFKNGREVSMMKAEQSSPMLRLPPPPVPKKPVRLSQASHYEEYVVGYLPEPKDYGSRTSPVHKPARPAIVPQEQQQPATHHPVQVFTSYDELNRHQPQQDAAIMSGNLSFSERLKAFQSNPAPQSSKPQLNSGESGRSRSLNRSLQELPSHSRPINTRDEVLPPKRPPPYSAPYISKLDSSYVQTASSMSSIDIKGFDINKEDNTWPTSIRPVSNIEPLHPVRAPSLRDNNLPSFSQEFKPTPRQRYKLDPPLQPSDIGSLSNTSTTLKSNAGISNRVSTSLDTAFDFTPKDGSTDYYHIDQPGLTSSPCFEPETTAQKESSAQRMTSLSIGGFDADPVVDGDAGGKVEQSKTNADDAVTDQTQTGDVSQQEDVQFASFLKDNTRTSLEDDEEHNDGTVQDLMNQPDALGSYLQPPPPPPPDFASDGNSSSDDDDVLDPPTLYGDDDVHAVACAVDKTVDDEMATRNISSQPPWSSCSSDSEEDCSDDGKVNLDELVLKKAQLLNQEDSLDDRNDCSLLVTASDATCNDVGGDEASGDRLVDVSPDQWLSDDVCNWLDLVGVGHLKDKFKGKGVTGKELLAIDVQLFDALSVTDVLDRELILAEIYSLKSGEENPEMSILDALDTVSGSDRDKMYALLEALRAPGGEFLMSSYQPSCSDASIESTSKPKQAYVKRPVSVPPGMGSRKQDNDNNGKKRLSTSMTQQSRSADQRSQGATPSSNSTMVSTGSNASQEISVESEKLETKENTKRKGFLKDALSFKRKGSGRLSKLFRSSSKSSTDETQTASKASGHVQGIIRIYTSEQECISLSISATMTCAEVIRSIAKQNPKLSDLRCYRLDHVIGSTSKKKAAESIVPLSNDELPLPLQMNCSPKDSSKFLLRHYSDAQIQIHLGTADQDPVKMHVVKNTTCGGVINVLIDKNLLPSTKTNDEVLMLFQNEGEAFPVQSDMRVLDVSGGTSSGMFHVQLAHPTPVVSETSLKNQQSDPEREHVIAKLENQMETSRKEKTSLLKKISSMKQAALAKDKDIKTLKENLEKSLHKTEFLQLQENLSTAEKESCVLREDRDNATKRITELEAMLNDNRSDGVIFKLKEELKEMEKNISSKSTQIIELERQLALHTDELTKIRQLSHGNARGDDEDLRDHVDGMEQMLTEKDTKLLDLESMLQSKEKEMLEIRRERDDEERHRKRTQAGNEELQDVNKALSDRNQKLESILSQKEKSLQTWRMNQDNLGEVSRREFTLLRSKIQEKDQTIVGLQQKLETNSADMKSKVETLQAMITKKEVKMKEREFSLMQECEEIKVQLNNSRQQTTETKNRLQEKESRLVDNQHEQHSKLLHLEASLADKTDSEMALRKKLSSLEDDFQTTSAITNRGMQDKEAVIRKLETKMAKHETNQRDNLRKFEKFMSEKDKILKQSKQDYESEIEELRSRIGSSEESLTAREKQLRDVKRASIAFKEKLELQLRASEEQSGQHKFLLERLLAFVSARQPTLVQDFEDSFKGTAASNSHPIRDTTAGDVPLAAANNDEWC